MADSSAELHFPRIYSSPSLHLFLLRSAYCRSLPSLQPEVDICFRSDQSVHADPDNHPGSELGRALKPLHSLSVQAPIQAWAPHPP
jgi:hypothetical protein